MYKRIQRLKAEQTWELMSYPVDMTQSNYVTNTQTLNSFYKAVEAHLKLNISRKDLYEYNVDIIKSEIESVTKDGYKYEKDCQTKLKAFYDFIKIYDNDENIDCYPSAPIYKLYGGDLSVDSLLMLLKAELQSNEDELSKHILRIKILNHNLKTVKELYD